MFFLQSSYIPRQGPSGSDKINKTGTFAAH
jgi:hypothetical protein